MHTLGMPKLLVIAQKTTGLEELRSEVEERGLEMIQRISIEGAEPLVRHGIVDACLVDVRGLEIQGWWQVQKIHHWSEGRPVFVYAPDSSWPWQREAYALGVDHVFTERLDPGLFGVLLERSLSQSASASAHPHRNFAASGLGVGVDIPPTEKSVEVPAGTPRPSLPSLDIVRNFSSVLAHSLCTNSLVEQFLLLLRELFGINRAMVFLVEQEKLVGNGEHTSHPADYCRPLQIECAIGIPASMTGHLRLSLDAGIGRYLMESGRIARRGAPAVRRDTVMTKEFELLGVEVAIPIPDRQSLVGVAVFDGRVTGESLSNQELELIFHLLEHLGLAIRNIRLHDQLAASHTMMAGILQQLTNACVVVNENLQVLHANKLAHRFFRKGKRRNAPFEFSDLPEALGTKVFQVLNTGSAMEPFDYRPADAPETVYHINLVPFHEPLPAASPCVLMLAEDKTQREQLKKLEIETAGLRLVKDMAERLAHEIGNALVPLATHEQLLSQKYDNEEFRASLAATMADSVKRISRLAKQMFFLARENFERHDQIPLKQLVEEAFQTAKEFYSGQNPSMKFVDAEPAVTIACDQAGLKYALTEILLNALQADPKKSSIKVAATCEANGQGPSLVHLAVSDSGGGFTEESARHAMDPFYSTRAVGIGLGLTVANKIIDRHRGNIRIQPAKDRRPHHVEIILPST